jgi:hypothetical protein
VAVLLSAVQDMKYFVMASFLGDLSVVWGMAVVIVYGTIETNQSHASSWGTGTAASLWAHYLTWPWRLDL